MRFHYYLIPLFVIVISSCSKKLDLKHLSFEATADKDTITTSDSAIFNFTGNPDIISFYSGEVGKRYEFRDRVADSGSNLQLKFTSATTTATNGILSLLISNNFNSTFNAAGVGAATWMDITNRATLATGTAAVSSGVISLADFAQQRKPVFLAFRSIAAAGAVQKKWTITSLMLNHVLPDSTYTIANMTATAPSPGWKSVDVKNPLVNWTASLVITGATTAAAAVETEDWIIMGPIDLSRVLPDAGTPLKNGTEGMNKFPFSYKYRTAGTYSAVFFVSNVNKDAQESTTKSVKITVH